VIPCREAAVDFCDILGALLGLTVVNDLGLASARRDKGLMKVAVANAGLRVAKYARLTQGDGSDVIQAVSELELEYPVVIKTPRGMSTMDVYICENEEEAVKRSAEVVRSVGPDGRKTQYALLEEFLQGEEFALNLMASPTTPRGVQVTDIWLYHKVSSEGTMVNTIQEMVDCHDRK
jgi:D-alanine-D-alanine ligase-like ATP-grasp enzyme